MVRQLNGKLAQLLSEPLAAFNSEVTNPMSSEATSKILDLGMPLAFMSRNSDLAKIRATLGSSAISGLTAGSFEVCGSSEATCIGVLEFKTRAGYGGSGPLTSQNAQNSRKGRFAFRSGPV